MDLQSIQTPNELLERGSEQNTYEFDQFIKLDKMGERRSAKRKLKLLKLIDQEVRNIVDEDEKVFYVTDGVLVNTFEQFFIGWVAYYYNLSAFVFTTKRVILIHLKGLKKRGVYLRSIEYADMRAVKGSALSGFKIQLVNGKTLTFSRVPGVDRKALGGFLNQVLDGGAPRDKQALGMRNLCPDCLSDYGEVLVGECHHCGMRFKTPRKAALLSLLMPGLGDIYLGSRSLGLLELCVMGFLWLSMIIGAIGEISAGVSIVGPLVMMAIVWIFIHPIDAIKSFHMGSKGLFPNVPPLEYGTVVPANIENPVIPKKAVKGKGRLLIAIPLSAFILAYIGLVILGSMGEAGIVPSGEIEDGNMVSAKTRQLLIENDILDQSSEIVYLYSDGFLSYLDGGTILTKHALVLYFHDENQQFHNYYFPLDQIREVVQVSQGTALQDSVYRANGYDEEAWLQFPLPVEGGRERTFINELNQRIASLRE